MTDFTAYMSLFFAAFTAATILPAQSEAVLSGMIVLGEYQLVALVVVASIGNVAGSVVNWMLGRGIEFYKTRRWFPVKPSVLDRANGWYHRFGKWSLLLSWAPIIGDPLTVVAGILREPLWSFLAIVSIAKTGRYVFLAYIVTALMKE